MKTTIYIAVLDDHDLIAEAIKSMINEHETYQFVQGFTKSAQLIEFLKDHQKIDILLLDIHLNHEDGLQVCKDLTNQFPQLSKIMLTSLTQQSLVAEALKNGARGYLPKNVSFEQLIDAFNLVTKGQIYLHPDITFVPTNNQNKSSYDYLPKLTRRETEILQLILDELTTQEIADKLCITVSTVETHRSSLLSKTGSKNVVGLIKYTIEKGLLTSQ